MHLHRMLNQAKSLPLTKKAYTSPAPMAVSLVSLLLQWPGAKPLNPVQILQTQKLTIGQIL